MSSESTTTSSESPSASNSSRYITNPKEMTCISPHVIERLYKMPDVSEEEKKQYLQIIDANFAEIESKLCDFDAKDEKGKKTWKLVADKSAYKIYQQTNDEHPVKLCAGVCEIEGFAINQIFDFLFSWEYSGYSDKFLVEGRDIGRVGDVGCLLYIQYAAVWPISNRDFLYLASMRQDRETGAFHCVVKSVKHSGTPEVKGVVRGDILSSHTIIEPLPGKTNAFKVTASFSVDPKGWIPVALVNMVLSEQVLVAQLHNNMQKFVDWCKNNKYGIATSFKK